MSCRLRATSYAVITATGSAVGCALTIDEMTPLLIRSTAPTPMANHSRNIFEKYKGLAQPPIWLIDREARWNAAPSLILCLSSL